MAEVAAKSAGEVSRALRRTAALRIDTADRVLIAVALALFALRLVIAGNTGLVDDEAYYRIWSLAPALSYFDHPPMVAWIIAAGRAIAGDTVIGVRLLAPASLLARRGPSLANGFVALWNRDSATRSLADAGDAASRRRRHHRHAGCSVCSLFGNGPVGASGT